MCRRAAGRRRKARVDNYGQPARFRPFIRKIFLNLDTESPRPPKYKHNGRNKSRTFAEAAWASGRQAITAALAEASAFGTDRESAAGGSWRRLAELEHQVLWRHSFADSVLPHGHSTGWRFICRFRYGTDFGPATLPSCSRRRPPTCVADRVPAARFSVPAGSAGPRRHGAQVFQVFPTHCSGHGRGHGGAPPSACSQG